MKAFCVDDGHDVLHRGVWHGPGVMVAIERDEFLAVYVTPNGRRGACIGKHSYDKLDPANPPAGLTRERRA